MSDLRDRLLRFVSISGATSISAFERNCGLSNGAVKNCKESLTSESLAKIVRTYPELDLYWLLGLVDDKQFSLLQMTPPERERIVGVKQNSNAPTESFLLDQIKRKDETIAVLQNVISNLQK